MFVLWLSKCSQIHSAYLSMSIIICFSVILLHLVYMYQTINLSTFVTDPFLCGFSGSYSDHFFKGFIHSLVIRGQSAVRYLPLHFVIFFYFWYLRCTHMAAPAPDIYEISQLLFQVFCLCQSFLLLTDFVYFSPPPSFNIKMARLSLMLVVKYMFNSDLAVTGTMSLYISPQVSLNFDKPWDTVACSYKSQQRESITLAKKRTFWL